MCIAGFGLRQGFARPAILMLCAWLHSSALAKNLLTQTLSLHRHSRTRSAGPGERGLERLFSITANYITARLAVRAKSLTTFRSLKPPDGACKDVCNGWRQMVSII